jgi:hypothetical protein
MSYIDANMTFGDSAKLFELMEVEKKKIAGESV